MGGFPALVVCDDGAAVSEGEGVEAIAGSGFVAAAEDGAAAFAVGCVHIKKRRGGKADTQLCNDSTSGNKKEKLQPTMRRFQR